MRKNYVLSFRFVATLLLTLGLYFTFAQSSSAQIGFGKDLSDYRGAANKSAKVTADKAEDLYDRLSKIGTNKINVADSSDRDLKKFYREYSKVEKNAEDLRSEFNNWIEHSDELFYYLYLLSEEIDPQYKSLYTQAKTKLKAKQDFIETFKQLDQTISEMEASVDKLGSIVKVVKISDAVSTYNSKLGELNDLQLETKRLTSKIIRLSDKGIALMEGF